MKKIIPNNEALRIIEESVKTGNSVHLSVKGNSMSPRLLDGKDKVFLHPFNSENLKPGDVILFRYKDAFLLHRIVEIRKYGRPDANIITRGDALKQREVIGYSDVVALADLPKIGMIKLTGRRCRILLNRIIKHIKRRLNLNQITLSNETNT